MSQIVPGASPHRIASRFPAGSNATPVGWRPPGIFNGAVTGSPVAAVHSRTVPSRLAVATRFPSGLNTASRTGPACFSRGPTAFPVAASHTWAVPSCTADTNSVSSMLKRRELSMPSWRISGVTGSPVATSHTRNPLKTSAANRVPVWLKQTKRAGWKNSRCFGETAGRPVSTCHTRTTAFCPPTANRFPSGLRATDRTPGGWANGPATRSPVAASHTHAVSLSCPTTNRPSGENAFPKYLVSSRPSCFGRPRSVAS